ncbi:MAG: MBL fold metallo-hydrolase, partial [Candidatus Bipolaricaulota bacterium]
QSLILESDRGPLVISGCAHPGITRIVQRAGKIIDRSPHLVLGGFHLGGTREEEINKVISELRDNSIDKLAPTHCTGEKAIETMRKEFQETFLEFGAGREILI